MPRHAAQSCISLSCISLSCIEVPCIHIVLHRHIVREHVVPSLAMHGRAAHKHAAHNHAMHERVMPRCIRRIHVMFSRVVGDRSTSGIVGGSVCLIGGVVSPIDFILKCCAFTGFISRVGDQRNPFLNLSFCKIFLYLILVHINPGNLDLLFH